MMIAENESPQAVGAAPRTDATNNECLKDTTEEFFRLVLPDAGLKVLAELVPVAGSKRAGWRYSIYDSFEVMAQAALQMDAQGRTVYHACNSFGDWYDDHKTNKKRLRTQANVVACRSLYDDIDVGKADTYATRKEAGAATKSFLTATSLPAPTIIYSGGGMHLYWPLTEDITPEHWQRLADKKRLVTQHFGLKIDTACDTDSARVLRPVGTTWRKTEDRTVTCKHQGTASQPDEIEALLDAYLNDNRVATPTASRAVPDWMKAEKGNLDDQVTEFPPTYMEVISEFCPQIKAFRENGGESEPVWHAIAGVAKHCADGPEKFHEWSAQYEGYDQAEAQAKLDNWETAPTTCDQFKKLNADTCKGCKHTCKSPISLGVEKSVAVSAGQADMNAQYAWLVKPAAIYRKPYRDFIAMDKFHAAHANQTQMVTEGRNTKPVTVSRLWLTSPDRCEHVDVVTRPGEPPVTSDNCLNDWAGFTVEPAPGDVAAFIVLWEYQFGAEKFPLLWVAHLLQKPGIKLFTALVVWSSEEGVGKNLLFETIGALFNPHHYALLGQSEVEDDFCGWIAGVVFALLDEIRAAKNDKSRDRMKLWTTSPTLRIHDKGTPKRVVDNLMNMVFLSNHADGMFLSDSDRRFYVHEVTAQPLPEKIKQDFLHWRANGGLPHLLHYLQSIDLTGFDPKGRAPVTASKLNMIEAGRSDLDRWVLDIVSGATPIGKEVATAEEMNDRFLCEFPHVRVPPPVATMGRVLVKMGALRRGNQVRLSNGKKVRALSLTRNDYWKGQPEAAWRAELEKRL